MRAATALIADALAAAEPCTPPAVHSARLRPAQLLVTGTLADSERRLARPSCRARSTTC
ncbi:hypothetical protein ACU686_23210 [Yinghuangia aomiensis]